MPDDRRRRPKEDAPSAEVHVAKAARVHVAKAEKPTAPKVHVAKAEKGGGGGDAVSKVLKKALKKEKYGGTVETQKEFQVAKNKKMQEKKARKKAAKKANKAAREAPEASQEEKKAVVTATGEHQETAEEGLKAKKTWKADMMAKKAENRAKQPVKNEALRAKGKQTKKELYKAKKAALKAAALGEGASPTSGETQAPPLDPTQRIDKKQCDCFLTGLAYTATEEHIVAHFKKAALGPCSAEVLHDPDSGRSKGTAFVVFDSAEHAARAVGMTGSTLHGRWIKVRLCEVRDCERRAAAVNVGPVERPEECLSIVISGLNDAIGEDDIWELFKDQKPWNVSLLNDRMAFVDFEDGSAVEEAVKMDGGVLKGKRILVRYKADKAGEGHPAKPEENQKKVDTKGVRPPREMAKPIAKMAKPQKFDSDSDDE